MILGRCWFEIDVAAIEHNIKIINSKIGDKCRLIAVLKGDGYGHGIAKMAKIVTENGVDLLAVAALTEALEIRNSGVETEIIVLGYTPIEQIALIAKNNITQTIYDKDYALGINYAAKNLDININCELKIDTGMSRIGFRNIKDILLIINQTNLKFKGIFSHFATADENTQDDILFAELQLERFEDICKQLNSQGIQFDRKHICNSSGTVRFPQAHFDYCRSGSLLVGFNTADGLHWDLKPAGTLKTVVSMVKSIPAGESVSYRRTYFAKKSTLVATLACGYADGYPRTLSNKAKVEIRGMLAPVIGTICMDQMMIDITNIPDVKVGDEVILYGNSQFSQLGVLPTASLADSVYVELITRLGKRVPKIYI